LDLEHARRQTWAASVLKELEDVLGTGSEVGVQELLADLGKGRVGLRVELEDGGRRLGPIQQVYVVPVDEGLRARQELVQHRAHREQVRARGPGAAAQGLYRHVRSPGGEVRRARAALGEEVFELASEPVRRERSFLRGDRVDLLDQATEVAA